MANETPPTYTLADLAKHTGKDDVWMAIHGCVYDVTPFLERHPGGAEVLLDCAGIDSTGHFDDVGHSEDSKRMLLPLFKGYLEGFSPNLPAKLPKPRKPRNRNKKSSKYRNLEISLVMVAVFFAAIFLLLQHRKWQ